MFHFQVAARSDADWDTSVWHKGDLITVRKAGTATQQLDVQVNKNGRHVTTDAWRFKKVFTAPTDGTEADGSALADATHQEPDENELPWQASSPPPLECVFLGVLVFSRWCTRCDQSCWQACWKVPQTSLLTMHFPPPPLLLLLLFFFSFRCWRCWTPGPLPSSRTRSGSMRPTFGRRNGRSADRCQTPPRAALRHHRCQPTPRRVTKKKQEKKQENKNKKR